MKTTGCVKFRFASGEVRTVRVGECWLGMTDSDGNRPIDYTTSIEITGRVSSAEARMVWDWLDHLEWALPGINAEGQTVPLCNNGTVDTETGGTSG